MIAAELSTFQHGEVLVAPMTDPDWEPVLARAAAVVTDHGGRTCHAAIVSRELGIPCVVGTGDGATTRSRTGDVGHGVVRRGRRGPRLRGDARRSSARRSIPRALPTPRVPVMLNVGNPGQCVPARPAARARASGSRASSSSCRRTSASTRWRCSTRSGSPIPPRSPRSETRTRGRRGPAGVLRRSARDRRRADRRGVLPAPGDRAVLGLQDQRVREPARRQARSSRSRPIR